MDSVKRFHPGFYPVLQLHRSEEVNRARSLRMEDSNDSWGNDVQMDLERSGGGISLVLQPSDDPAAPLNWSLSIEIMILSVVSLASFIYQ